ncbi:hypothetical protein SADUNF_Sadunf15G0070400 [Salix dunnii]|uniref:Ribosomal protein S4 n=1 Tax=Salix dunnii TaxID=1413687 RepID=A0A835JB19_9ROSI|nr:hypothetical protein SADUNF_Sadunf15G0070400 [Salix dunnii]
MAPKPSSGPRKSRECLPLILILRNRLKYALTYREVIAILMQRHVFVDGKVGTDKTYPSGFMGMCEYSLFTPVTFMNFLCGSSKWDLEFVSSNTWYQMGNNK